MYAYDIDQDEAPEEDELLFLWLVETLVDDDDILVNFLDVDNFLIYEQLGFTCEEDFFGQDLFPLYTDFDHSFIYPFSDNWETFRFKNLDNFQKSFFGADAFFFDDKLFEGFFQNLANKFAFIDSKNTFPVISYINNDCFFFNNSTHLSSSTYPQPRFDFDTKFLRNLHIQAQK